MPVYPPSGGAIGLSPSSSFASDSLDSTTPKPSAPIGSLQTGHLQTRSDTGSDGTPSSRGSGKGSVKFLLALNAPSTVPWGLIRAKVSRSHQTIGAGVMRLHFPILYFWSRSLAEYNSDQHQYSFGCIFSAVSMVFIYRVVISEHSLALHLEK